MTTTEQKKFNGIPVKYRERVEEVEDDRGEENGWWIHLRDGWAMYDEPGLHTIHEDSWALCIKYLRWTLPCTCSVCLKTVPAMKPTAEQIREVMSAMGKRTSAAKKKSSAENVGEG